MMDTEPRYDVVQRQGLFYVETSGIVVTVGTRDKTLAEKWCRDLRRAAQVEADRKVAARGGR